MECFVIQSHLTDGFDLPLTEVEGGGIQTGSIRPVSDRDVCCKGEG